MPVKSRWVKDNQIIIMQALQKENITTSAPKMDKPINKFQTLMMLEEYIGSYNEHHGKKIIKSQHYYFFKDRILKAFSEQLEERQQLGQDRGIKNALIHSHYDCYTVNGKCKAYFANQNGRNFKTSATVSTTTIYRWLKVLDKAEIIKLIPDSNKLRFAISPMVIKYNNGWEIIAHKTAEIFDISLDNTQNSNLLNDKVLEKNTVTNCNGIKVSRNTNTKITTTVDKINTVKHDEELTQCFLPEPLNNNPKKPIVNTGESGAEKEISGGSGGRISQNKARFINDLVAYLYVWILDNLYANVTLETSQKQHIIRYFVNEAQAQQGHFLQNQFQSFTMKRLRKWKAYLDRDPNRFTTFPTQFFNDDIDFLNYSDTINWLKSDSHFVKTKKLEREINKHIRAMKRMIDPNKHSDKRYWKPELNDYQKALELQKLQKQAEKYAAQHNRPDLAARFNQEANKEWSAYQRKLKN